GRPAFPRTRRRSPNHPAARHDPHPDRPASGRGQAPGGAAQRYPGLHVSDSASLATATDADNELNHWLGPFFVAMIFVFTSIAVLNTLIMIALRRRREPALLRLVGATTRQVRSMARWEAILIITIGLGIVLAGERWPGMTGTQF